jgi:hypothetical protein
MQDQGRDGDFAQQVDNVEITKCIMKPLHYFWRDRLTLQFVELVHLLLVGTGNKK